MKTVIGVFEDRVDAEDAITALKDEGYDAKDISIVMRDRNEAQTVVHETGANDVAGGTVSGAATGAIIGGLAGLLAAVAIPGLGAFFIGGPIAAALGLGGAAATTVSGATTGAVAGGLIGALTSLGLTHEEAQVYEDRVNNGAILVAVPARRDEEADVEDILTEYEASDIRTVSARDDSISDDEILRRSRREDRGTIFVGAKGGESRRSIRRR